jgi:hypothetical protein
VQTEPTHLPAKQVRDALLESAAEEFDSLAELLASLSAADFKSPWPNSRCLRRNHRPRGSFDAQERR